MTSIERSRRTSRRSSILRVNAITVWFNVIARQFLLLCVKFILQLSNGGSLTHLYSTKSWHPFFVLMQMNYVWNLLRNSLNITTAHCDILQTSLNAQSLKHLRQWFDEDCRRSHRVSRLIERHYKSQKSGGDRAAWVAQVRAKHTLSSVRGELLQDDAHCSSRPRQSQVVEVNLIYSQATDQPIRPLWKAFNLLLFESYHWRRYDGFWFSLQPKHVHWIQYQLLASIDVLLPIILIICNASLTEGSQKEATTTLVIKQPGLDPDNTKSYRPVSNRYFISKVIKRIVS